jgi:23S rRNA pseudouridine955/2504/2580 synthase
MRAVIAGRSHANKRIDRVVREMFPNMPSGAVHKAFRKKDVKVNGIRVKNDFLISAGDRIEIFVIDEILDGVPLQDNHKLNRGFTIVYEDMNLLIVNKEQGVQVHPDQKQPDNTLIDSIRRYLSEKGEYDPGDPASFPPSLCHRLDRNTGGLLIAAKNDESRKIILEKMKAGEIRKYYLCLVKGKMKEEQARLRAYLYKDEFKSRVFVNEVKSRGSAEIITGYRLVSYDPDSDISRLEVELVTGRTHQIRAHLAYIGHPIIGDGKYGTNSINRSYNYKYQALWAFKIKFDIKGAGILDYLKGKQFQVKPDFR